MGVISLNGAHYVMHYAHFPPSTIKFQLPTQTNKNLAHRICVKIIKQCVCTKSMGFKMTYI